VYAFESLGYVGFELWQVKAGSIFDNIIVTDSIDEAEAFLADTYTKNKDSEKTMFEAADKEKREREEADRKKAEEERKKADTEKDTKEDDDDDDDDDDSDDKKKTQEKKKEHDEL